MDERDFELLITLKKTKNITRAADHLFVTQSSLSKRINAIERELDIPLLIRSRNGVHFTPEGEEVLKRVSEASKQLKIMRDNLEAQKDYVSGTLNAGISINYSLYKLSSLLSIYKERYPYVKSNIIADHSRKLYTQLLEGSIDVAILRGDFPWKGHKVLLEHDAICAIIHPDDKDIPLQELPFISRTTDSGFEREISQWMQQHAIKPDVYGICVNNISTCVEMVNKRLGWSIVPEICLSDFKGKIIPLTFSDGTPFIRPTYLMYSDEVLNLPQVKSFIDTCLTSHKNNSL